MGTVTTLPRGQAFTPADLEAMPDDGRRYELIDGSLIVTPAPSNRHQGVLLGLVVVLQAACPESMTLRFAPLDVRIGEKSVLQPDLLVARRSDFDERGLPAVPLLAVEVLSPSTRHIDLGLKMSRYEAAGCPSYWIVDPDEPAATAWNITDGCYEQAAHATGTEQFETDSPFPVGFQPVELLR